MCGDCDSRGELISSVIVFRQNIKLKKHLKLPERIRRWQCDKYCKSWLYNQTNRQQNSSSFPYDNRSNHKEHGMGTIPPTRSVNDVFLANSYGRFRMESTVSHSGKVKVSGYNNNPGVWDVCGSQILCIGVVAHKTSHFLGLLDLYDPDGGGYGLGIQCLMADSWGADASQLYLQ